MPEIINQSNIKKSDLRSAALDLIKDEVKICSACIESASLAFVEIITGNCPYPEEKEHESGFNRKTDPVVLRFIDQEATDAIGSILREANQFLQLGDAYLLPRDRPDQ